MHANTLPGLITGSYAIDPNHSRLGFVVRHAVVSRVRGSFKEFDGSGYFDLDEAANSYLRLSVVTASIDTGNADRDAHLRSSDFFDVERYPEMTFTSTDVERNGFDSYQVKGDLALRGITRPVTIELNYEGSAIDPDGDRRIGFDGRGAISRKDWGLTWNTALEAGGVLVSDSVELELGVAAIRRD